MNTIYKKLKQMWLVAMLLVACQYGYSQQEFISPQVLATTGGYVVAGGYSHSFTVGQSSVVETLSKDGIILTQGFQQPDGEKVTGLIDISKTDEGAFVVYPNPAVGNIYYGFEFPDNGIVNVELTTITGQLINAVTSYDYNGGKVVENVNLSAYSAGTYFMVLHYTNTQSGKSITLTRKIQIIT